MPMGRNEMGTWWIHRHIADSWYPRLTAVSLLFVCGAFSCSVAAVEQFPKESFATLKKADLDHAVGELDAEIASLASDGGIHTPAYADALERRGTISMLQGRFGSAEADMQRALALESSLSEKRDLELSRAITNLSKLLFLKGDTDGVRSIIDRYSNYSSAAARVACLDAKVRLGIEQDDSEEARAAFDAAMQLQKTLDSGQRQPIMPEILNTGAMLALAEGDNVSAERYAQSGIANANKAGDVLSRTESLNLLAQSYVCSGNPAAAEPAAQESCDERSDLMGDDHPLVAECYSTSGLIQWSEEKPAAARDLFEKSMSIWNSLGSSRHPSVAWNAFALAMVDIDLHQVPEATQYYENATAIEEQILYRAQPLILAQRELFVQRLEDNHLYPDAMKFRLNHGLNPAPKKRSNRGRFGLFSSVLTRCADLESKHTRGEAASQYSGSVQFITALGWLTALVFGIVLLQVTVLPELVKDKHGKILLKFRRKKTDPLLKTIYGADGKLGLKSAPNASATHWIPGENLEESPSESGVQLQDEQENAQG
jgi:hypothetical protein